MSSKIDFTPLTPEALKQLTRDERIALGAAAPLVAASQKPGLEATATLLLAVARLAGQLAGDCDGLTWDQVRDDLNRYRDAGLILSWREVEGSGLVVVAGDMAERDLLTLRDADAFLGGLASAECAVRDGKAGRG